MSLSMHDVADQINALFQDYGLDHDVVEVYTVLPRGRATDPTNVLVFINGDDLEAMTLLLESFKMVFQVYFEVQPPNGQMRLF